MSKKTNKRTVSAKYNGPMTGGMKFFLAGCVAELYLLIIRRFYINGSLEQVLSWNGYLKVFAGVGVAAAIVGAVLSFLWKADRKRRTIGWYVLGLGLFVAVASALVLFDMNALAILTTLVPVVLVLDILWCLFDHDSALALTSLAGALMVAWLCRRGAAGTSGLMVKGAAVVYLAALAALVVVIKGGKLSKFVSSDGSKMVYTACAISAVGVAAALVSTAVAYYAMWALAAVVFCMAVFYTVRQL